MKTLSILSHFVDLAVNDYHNDCSSPWANPSAYNQQPFDAKINGETLHHIKHKINKTTLSIKILSI